ncbi:hypothetical protein BU16DRAFT_557390 [Lophium mytilinum]|uniref:Uncharacterized protein n=1 Tax=Lophium mytilinum TaxID=390894 RepID=A0A6A6R3I3_9PEZI|nr:hypothetical protein BU16DRAFT_557390 [Lophium mytilinum]
MSHAYKKPTQSFPGFGGTRSDKQQARRPTLDWTSSPQAIEAQATMAGPAKKRARVEQSSSSSSDDQKSSRNGGCEGSPQRSSLTTLQRASPQSIPRVDDNRDTQGGVSGRRPLPIEYLNLRNLSDALGMMGWAAASYCDEDGSENVLTGVNSNPLAARRQSFSWLNNSQLPGKGLTR